MALQKLDADNVDTIKTAFSAPRDDAARANCENEGKSNFLLFGRTPAHLDQVIVALKLDDAVLLSKRTA